MMLASSLGKSDQTVTGKPPFRIFFVTSPGDRSQHRRSARFCDFSADSSPVGMSDNRAFGIWLAGGGVKRGYVHGATDGVSGYEV